MCWWSIRRSIVEYIKLMPCCYCCCCFHWRCCWRWRCWCCWCCCCFGGERASKRVRKGKGKTKRCGTPLFSAQFWVEQIVRSCCLSAPSATLESALFWLARSFLCVAAEQHQHQQSDQEHSNSRQIHGICYTLVSLVVVVVVSKSSTFSARQKSAMPTTTVNKFQNPFSEFLLWKQTNTLMAPQCCVNASVSADRGSCREFSTHQRTKAS